MGSNVLVAGFARYSGATKYEYGQAGRNGVDTNGNGIPEVDCSALVGNALKDAGYAVPSSGFTTRTLFAGSTLTDYAKQQFTNISSVQTTAKNGSLRAGDIIMFGGVGIDAGTQHIGIFYGYDALGNPMFYGAQKSTGPAVATAAEGRYWSRDPNKNSTDGFVIIGALRPKETAYDPAKDTTRSLTTATGTGLVPGTPSAALLTADSAGGLSYYAVDTSQVSSRIYTNGVIYRKDKTTGEDYWQVPLDGGGYRAVTRKATGEANYYDYDSNGKLVNQATEIATGLWQQQTDTNGDGILDSRRLVDGNGAVNNLTSLQEILDAEHKLAELHDDGKLDLAFYNDFTKWSTQLLLTGGSTICRPALDYSPDLSLDPIGAFYESRSAAKDPALSIAGKTAVILDGANRGMTAAGLAGLDANRDGRLGGNELGSLKVWTDLNEDGLLDSGETKTLAQAGINDIRAGDYAFYTRGNARYADAAQMTTPAVPAGNYRTLRDTDNLYYIRGLGWVNWTGAYIKIGYSHRDTLVGTDGNDNFEFGYRSRTPMFATNCSWSEAA